MMLQELMWLFIFVSIVITIRLMDWITGRVEETWASFLWYTFFIANFFPHPIMNLLVLILTLIIHHCFLSCIQFTSHSSFVAKVKHVSDSPQELLNLLN